MKDYLPNITLYRLARRAGSDGSMPASGSAGPGFDPGRVVNFHLKIFNIRARRGGDVHFLIARLYISPGLNSKPFRSIYVEKAYSTVDSDSFIGWGRLTWWPPWCFSRRAGYELALGFTFSLPFIIIPHNTITLHKQLP